MPLGNRQREMLQDLVGTPSTAENEVPILERIEEYFHNSDCRVRRVPIVGDPHGRWNLVVEKGTGSKSVFLYGHVDTFSPRWKPVNYRPHPTNGKFYGPGCYDMKAGLMEIIDHMLNVPVPEGMKFVAVFSPDEELHSRGAVDEDLQRQMEAYDFVAGFSPDISVMEGQSSDSPKGLIASRRGVLKGQFRLRAEQGHGAKSIYDAVQLFRDLDKRLLDIAENLMPKYMNIVSNIRVAGVGIPNASDLSQADKGVVPIKAFLVPPMTVDEALALLRAQTRDLAGVSLKKLGNVRSYNPYGIDTTTRMAEEIFKAGQKIYGKCEWVGDNSPSDGNVWVPWLQSRGNDMPWIEGSAAGGGEHSKNEWVDEESIVRHMAFTRLALTQSIPDALAHAT